MAADEELFDVQVRAWANGAFDWFPLASGVPAEAVEAFRKSAVWEVAATGCESAAEPVPPVADPPSEAAEYAVWMRYPSAGGKVPWGLLADRLTPQQARAYLAGPQIQLNVQPANDPVRLPAGGSAAATGSAADSEPAVDSESAVDAESAVDSEAVADSEAAGGAQPGIGS